jgi:anti-sigma-K factor RskA
MPGFIASLNFDRDEISVRRLTGPPQKEKSYELWAIGGGRDKPQSLGVVETVLNIPVSQLRAPLASLEKTSLAISLEPRGGSPTGQPTGAILFTGKLVAVP